MMILTAPIRKALLKNGEISKAARLRDGNVPEMKPVLKLFGGGACTWLISEMEPGEDGDFILFGLCDLGMGSPELGSVRLNELLGLRFPPFGLRVERDRWWTPTKTLAEYAKEAQVKGRINA